MKIGEVTPIQRLQIEKLLKEYQDRFALKLGKTTITTHKINTGDEKLISQRYYKVIEDKRIIIKKEIEKMLNEGIIQEANGTWSSPVVLVTKKDEETRFCIDYRKLNGITMTNTHPLPRIDELLEKYRTEKWFTSIYLASGY